MPTYRNDLDASLGELLGRVLGGVAGDASDGPRLVQLGIAEERGDDSAALQTGRAEHRNDLLPGHSEMDEYSRNDSFGSALRIVLDGGDALSEYAMGG